MLQVETTKKLIKVNACLFCGALVQRYARHLEQHHKGEQEVADLKNAMPEVRRKGFADIMARGNWAHNKKVLVEGEPDALVLKKQASAKAKEVITEEEVLPCQYCNQLYRRPNLYRHFNECQKNPNPKQNRGSAKTRALMILPKEYKIKKSSEKHILNRLRQGEVKDIIKNDTLLIRFLNVAIENAFTQSAWKHLRHRVRALAQFLQCARQVEGKAALTLTDALLNVRENLFPTVKQFTNDFQKFNNTEQIRSDLLLLYDELIIGEGNSTQEAVWDKYVLM